MRYLLARVGQSVFLLAGISLLSFAFLQLAPGNYFSEMRLNPQISGETVDHLTQEFGLNQPIQVRYWYWLRSVAHGEMGVSFAYNTPVASLLLGRARNTLLLTSIAMVLAWLIAVPLGVVSAAYPSQLIARISSFGSATLLAAPELLLALVALMLAVRTGWMRRPGFSASVWKTSAEWEGIRLATTRLTIPVLVLVLANFPILFQHTASAMRESLASRFVWAAGAHGISAGRILFRHALPAALNPLVSLLGTSIATLLSASLLVEVVLGWPGVGPLLLEAILNRDVYVVIGGVMLSACFLIAGMLFSDMLLFIVDPRIRAERLA